MAVLDSINDYSILRRDINKLRRDISEVERKIKANREYRDKEEQAINELDLTEKSNMEVAKKRQLEEHISKATSSVKDKLTGISNKQSEAKQRYDAKMSYFDSDDCINDYMDDLDTYDELDDVINSIHSGIEDAVGAEFKDKLLIELSNVAPVKSLSVKKIHSMKKRLESALEEIQNQPNQRNREVLNDLTGFIDSLDAGDSDNLKGEWFVLFVAAISLGAIFLTKYIAPLYISGLMILFALNYHRHSKLFRNAILFSYLTANLEAIKGASRKEALDKLQQDKDDYISSYSDAVEKLSERESKLKELLARIEEQARNDFVFDESSVISSMDQRRTQHKTRIAELDKEISSYEVMLKDYNSRLQDMESKLSLSSEQTKMRYLDLTRIGDSFLLDKSFLIDVGPSGQPIMWEFPETNILIVSENEEDYFNFTGLIVAQLRNRLSPFALKVTIVDSKGAGIQYQHLVDSGSTVGNIITSDQEFREEMVSIIETQEARISTILREFSTIAEYNAYMLSIDSLAESYMFYFVPFPKENLLKDESLTRILNVCYKVGIYFIFYASKKNLEFYKDVFSFVDTIQNFYVMENGQLGKWAKSYVIDLLQETKNGGV